MVAASESERIAMARALITPHAFDMWALFSSPRTLPKKIGPTCASLLQDALAQVWPALWRRDAARPGASLDGGRPVRGRGWERHSPTPLTFSATTIELLRWLVSVPLATAAAADELPRRPLAIGDQVAIYLALDAARDTPAQATIARQPMVRAAPLAWLGFAHLMVDAEHGIKLAAAAPTFETLATGAGAIVVEALSLELATRWRSIEIAKRALQDPDTLVALGAAQDAALTGFMDACDHAKRRDLAGFVLDAVAPLLERGIGPFPGELDLTKPLSSRAAARVAVGSLLRAVARWRTWDESHRGIRFIDDDYAAAQLLLTRFERIGRAGVDRSDVWLAELASLAPTTAPASATIEPP